MQPIERPGFLRCWKCHGPLQDETVIDQGSGLSIRHFLCLGCGRRWPSGEQSRPAIAAWIAACLICRSEARWNHITL